MKNPGWELRNNSGGESFCFSGNGIGDGTKEKFFVPADAPFADHKGITLVFV